jgi:hypothetical protein
MCVRKLFGKVFWKESVELKVLALLNDILNTENHFSPALRNLRELFFTILPVHGAGDVTQWYNVCLA